MTKGKKISQTDYSISPDKLARTFYGPLTRYFRRRGEQDSTVQDLVQEVFARLYNRGQRQIIENMEAYLMQTASNVWKDYLRYQYARAAKYHVEYEEVIHAIEEIGVERIYGGKNVLQKILELVESLPERQRQVLVLCRLEGMTKSAVAKRLNVSISSVEKDLVSARP